MEGRLHGLTGAYGGDRPAADADIPAPVRLIADYGNLVTTRQDERFVARGHRPKVFLPGLRVAATDAGSFEVRVAK